SGGGGSAGTESVTSTFTPMASGGPVSAGSAYVVGERGPELLFGASGRIASNAESRRMVGAGGSTHYYSIDARGADPAIYEQRTERAIRAAHDSAVGVSIRASHDQVRRTPAGR
ncbi:MAG TPA: hypothetical protein VNH18_05440, partial [Bryobacteraceae bacterium]|nr:hypothetical protein [Bryobacteraceae bacterium]